ncbi:MAG: flagellin, partial [SAR324 cluster bacterium]|nr:flagellin [SAR324 cluster bacterium]
MGSLVINHNVSAINTQRNLLQVDKQLKTSLEHLSSGERIVRAADGPADLMISEQMRAQIASVEQAIRNSETSVSMVQTTEAALNEVNRALITIRQRAIHAANEGANDENMLFADQLEVTNTLEALDRIARFSQFGTKTLLDGSNGVNGVAAGSGLTFMSATEDTRGSPAEGYAVIIKKAATRANVVSEEPLNQEVINAGVELTPKEERDLDQKMVKDGIELTEENIQERSYKGIDLILQESGKVASYTTQKDDDPRVVVRQLQNAIDMNGLQLEVFISNEFGELDIDGDRLSVVHREYGSEPTF